MKRPARSPLSAEPLTATTLRVEVSYRRRRLAGRSRIRFTMTGAGPEIAGVAAHGKVLEAGPTGAAGVRPRDPAPATALGGHEGQELCVEDDSAHALAADRLFQLRRAKGRVQEHGPSAQLAQRD